MPPLRVGRLNEHLCFYELRPRHHAHAVPTPRLVFHTLPSHPSPHPNCATAHTTRESYLVFLFLGRGEWVRVFRGCYFVTFVIRTLPEIMAPNLLKCCDGLIHVFIGKTLVYGKTEAGFGEGIYVGAGVGIIDGVAPEGGDFVG